MANEVAATSRKEERSDELLASLAELLECQEGETSVEKVSARLVAIVQERKRYEAMVEEVCSELECGEDDLVDRVSELTEEVEEAEGVMETLEVFQSVLGLSDLGLRMIVGSADKAGAMQKEIGLGRGPMSKVMSKVDPCRSLVSLLVEGLSHDPEEAGSDVPVGQATLRSV